MAILLAIRGTHAVRRIDLREIPPKSIFCTSFFVSEKCKWYLASEHEMRALHRQAAHSSKGRY